MIFIYLFISTSHQSSRTSMDVQLSITEKMFLVHFKGSTTSFPMESNLDSSPILPNLVLTFSCNMPFITCPLQLCYYQ